MVGGPVAGVSTRASGQSRFASHPSRIELKLDKQEYKQDQEIFLLTFSTFFFKFNLRVNNVFSFFKFSSPFLCYFTQLVRSSFKGGFLSSLLSLLFIPLVIPDWILSYQENFFRRKDVRSARRTTKIQEGKRTEQKQRVVIKLRIFFFREDACIDKSGFREKNRDTPLPGGRMMIGRLECWEQESWWIRVRVRRVSCLLEAGETVLRDAPLICYLAISGALFRESVFCGRFFHRSPRSDSQ